MYTIHHAQTDDILPHQSSKDQISRLLILIPSLLSATICFLFLESKHEVSLSRDLIPLLILNILATASTITLAPAVLQQTRTNTSRTLVIFAVPGMTALMCQQSGIHIFLSHVQILAFLVSISFSAFTASTDSESRYSSEEDWLELPLNPRDEAKHLDLPSIDETQDHTRSPTQTNGLQLKNSSSLLLH